MAEPSALSASSLCDLRVNSSTSEFTHLLLYSRERLELRSVSPKAPGPVYADFVGGKVGYRHRHGGGRGQPIAKAVGLRKGAAPGVLDATAGLGRDAFVLASLGCAVTLVERSPVVAALLRDGLRRAQNDPEAAAVVVRMALVEEDAVEAMARLAGRFEVVHLDPMYPHRDKSALVKKEMRLFRDLVGEDPDADRLLAAALACAAKRVVVKRPRGAPPLADRPPNHTVESKTTRYDVYLAAPAMREEG
ncbi:class I SAM-dependent methyltransferase [Endothiovibrio diazotrophicus]